MPAEDEDLLTKLERSPRKIQRTYKKALDSAHETYDSQDRAHRTAWSAVKHTAEKKGDHWELKEQKGPSDRKAATGGRSRSDTAGGVDANKTKRELYDDARKAGLSGRSKMAKDALVNALRRHNDRETARAHD